MFNDCYLPAMDSCYYNDLIGCDIRIVQTILKHNDIRTTLRYAHVSDKTKRERYERCLVL
ncbi:MAG: hypothetical protein ABR985_13010 [Methanotrichaceae archaeon]|jgi:integrase